MRHVGLVLVRRGGVVVFSALPFASILARVTAEPQVGDRHRRAKRIPVSIATISGSSRFSGM
jgi:hypothetical protein